MHKKLAKCILIISKIKHLNKNRDIINSLILKNNLNFCSQKLKGSRVKEEVVDEKDMLNDGTQYTNWMLSRAGRHNHNISHLRRKFLKDRFSIHKLTNIKFLCALVNNKNEYTLNINQKIILLAQLNHIFNLLNKDKTLCNQFKTLTNQIIYDLSDPHDLVCLGTFLANVVNIGNFNNSLWQLAFDSLIVKKYDEQYDQIFGIIWSLNQYKQWILSMSEYQAIQQNTFLQIIPIVYRNNLQLLRQFVKFNVYNMKQCRTLFSCLFKNNINQRYFWESVSDWFNIYIKQQLNKKDFDQYFIISEKAVQKVINDDGMIRPKPILQEISQIAYILSQNGMLSKRFVAFVQNLVLYSIQNGSNLYARYITQFSHKEQIVTSKQFETISDNQAFKTTKEQQKQTIKLMQRRYKIIFVNPIQIKNQSIIYLLVVLKKNTIHKQNLKSRYDQAKQTVQIDQRVLKWLLILLCKPQMCYTTSELLQIIDCLQFFTFAKINLQQIIIQKISNIRNLDSSLNDLKKLMVFLPLDQFQILNSILQNFLRKSHPSQIYQLTTIIEYQSISIGDQQYGNNVIRKEENQKWIAYLKKYFLNLPEIVNFHEKYYSFQENCYFLYYLLKNQIYWENKKYQGNYLGQMEKLKESVKTASYSRGFKLQMSSYFYKLLNYVDLVQFFEGGNI